MHVKRILTLSVAGGALAAWLAAAATTGQRPRADNFVRTTTPVEMRGAELAAEIARLRERLRPTAAPQAPARNLFQYSRLPSSAPSVSQRPPVTDEPAAAPARVAPPLRLVGIAEDEGADGAVRTAIISAGGQLIFAKLGERVMERYEIARISGEAAELHDLEDNSTLTLVLK